MTGDLRIRPLDETDLGEIVAIDEQVSGAYRPEVWENRILYYMRRDPDSSLVAEIDGRVAGFIIGEVRAGDFGLEEPTGWIEVVGVDPAARGKAVGRRLADALVARFREKGATSVRTLVDEASHGTLSGFFGSLGFAVSPVKTFVLPLQE